MPLGMSDVRPPMQQQKQAKGMTTPSILCKQSSVNRRLNAKACHAGLEHCCMQRSTACTAGSLCSNSAGKAGRTQTGPACIAGSSGLHNTAVTAGAAHRPRQSSSASGGTMSSSKCLDHSAAASVNALDATSQGCDEKTAMALRKRSAAALPRFPREQSAVSRAGLYRRCHVKKGLARQRCYSQGYSNQGHAGEDATTESQAEWYQVAEEFERMLIPAGEYMCCCCASA